MELYAGRARLFGTSEVTAAVSSAITNIETNVRIRSDCASTARSGAPAVASRAAPFRQTAKLVGGHSFPCPEWIETIAVEHRAEDRRAERAAQAPGEYERGGHASPFGPINDFLDQHERGAFAQLTRTETDDP